MSPPVSTEIIPTRMYALVEVVCKPPLPPSLPTQVPVPPLMRPSPTFPVSNLLWPSLLPQQSSLPYPSVMICDPVRSASLPPPPLNLLLPNPVYPSARCSASLESKPSIHANNYKDLIAALIQKGFGLQSMQNMKFKGTLYNTLISYTTFGNQLYV